MTDDKYTVTFKLANWRAQYWQINEKGEKELDHSRAGHMWYSLRKNTEKATSIGFHAANRKAIDTGDIKGSDDKDYLEIADTITIQINEEQYNNLRTLGKEENNPFFDTSRYNVISHNCVTFLFKALNIIGYNPSNIYSGTKYTQYLQQHGIEIENALLRAPYVIPETFNAIPQFAFDDLIDLLAQNKAIEIKGNTLVPVAETRSIFPALQKYEITGYNGINNTIIGGRGDDRLVGGDKGDILNGGGYYALKDDLDEYPIPDGNDTLEGGEGNDIYYIGGKDTIIDSDGWNEIRFLDKDYRIKPEDKDDKASPTIEIQSPVIDFSKSYNEFTGVGQNGEEYTLGVFDLYALGNVDTYEPQFLIAYCNSFSAKKVVITEKSTGHQVTINDFNSAKFNIHFSYLVMEDGSAWPYVVSPEFDSNDDNNDSNEPDDKGNTGNSDPINNHSSSDNASSHHYDITKGQGEQTIYADPKKRHIDTLNLSDAVSTHITYQLKGNDLLLSGFHQDTPTDAVRLKGFLNSDHPIKNFQFSDRTLTIEQMQNEGITLSGTAKDDIMYDWQENANTTFNAGAGYDKIIAGAGNDTLIGGEGNDQLNGGLGSDTYVFAKGHGQDMIIESRGNLDDSDMIRFEDALFDDVRFRRDNYDLTLFGYHQNDSVTLKSFFVNPDHQIEQFDFTDRSLSLAELKQAGTTWVGTDNNDTLTDWEGSANSVLYGGNGNDKITAGDGNDVLIGGKGRDQLNGGRGADSYLFAKGHGQDMVVETAPNAANTQDNDRLHFTDVNFAEVTFRRNNYDLILSGYHQDDAVTIKAFYANPSYQIEGFDFADRSVNWDNNSNSLITASDEERAHYLAAYDKIIHAMAAFGGNSSTDISLTPQEENKSSLGLIGASSYLSS